MIYDANIGERCETMRTWFDGGSQQITQITQIIFLPTEIIFANGEHEEHEVFFFKQQKTQIFTKT